MIQGCIGNQVISAINVQDLINKKQIQGFSSSYSANDVSQVKIQTSSINTPCFQTQTQFTQIKKIQIPIPIYEVSKKHLSELRNKKQNLMLKQKIQFQ